MLQKRKVIVPKSFLYERPRLRRIVGVARSDSSSCKTCYKLVKSLEATVVERKELNINTCWLKRDKERFEKQLKYRIGERLGYGAHTSHYTEDCICYLVFVVAAVAIVDDADMDVVDAFAKE